MAWQRTPLPLLRSEDNGEETVLRAWASAVVTLGGYSDYEQVWNAQRGQSWYECD